jgi:hypothetical protein
VADGGENPNHFLNLDWKGYGQYPFAELPRDYTAAVARFGRARIEENGTVPWRVEEYHGNLRRAFEAYRRPTALRRFESVLFERYRAELMLSPQPLPPVRNPRDFTFDRLLESTQLVPAILKYDLQAIGKRSIYDDTYYAAFFSATRPVLERRLSESISAVAALIAGAWEARRPSAGSGRRASARTSTAPASRARVAPTLPLRYLRRRLGRLRGGKHPCYGRLSSC